MEKGSDTIKDCVSNHGRTLDFRKGIAFRNPIILTVLGTLSLILLSTGALGSTPGCPDCPDWVNFDSWWDRYHSSSADSEPSPSPRNLREIALESREEGDDPSDMVYLEAELLAQAGDDLSGRVILDARSPEEYGNGHLPGARNLYWKEVRPGGVLNPGLAIKKLREIGLNETDSVVISGNGDASAYLFWALDYLGHEELCMLDGDISSIDLELVQNAPLPQESNYIAKFKPWISVNGSTLEEVPENLTVQIVDAQPSFADYGMSHLQNSIYIRTDLVYSDPEGHTLKSAGELEEFFSGRGLDREKVQLVYGTPDACSLYFALKLMGYDAMVLDGDWWEETDIAVSSIS